MNYDENDGFFDHVPPLTPPVGGAPGKSTVALDGELYQGVPVGLGPRVPMIVVSPWTKGGWVNSQLFDHTSVIRLLEARFGVAEPQITPWRRAVTGDLTSVFDFDAPSRDPDAILPDASGLPARARAQASLPPPRPPTTPAPLPRQEPGARRARALPYAFDAWARRTPGGLALTIDNFGKVGAGFGLYPFEADAGGPWFYAVEPGRTLHDELAIGPGGYDFTLHGANGFLRRFCGGQAEGVEVRCSYDQVSETLLVAMHNHGARALTVQTANAYAQSKTSAQRLAPNASVTHSWRIAPAGHWYDVHVTAAEDPRFLRRLAGHIETGRPSRSDPGLDRSPV